LKGYKMFILSNLLIAVANILNVLLTIAYWLILIRALISPQSQDKFHSKSPAFFHSDYALPPPSFLIGRHKSAALDYRD